MKQLEWIDDGYCECLKLGTGTIVYRPMLWHERADLWRVCKSEAILAAAINSRIVQGPRFDDVQSIDKRSVFDAVCRPGSRQHLDDEANLRTGVRIEMLYPHLSKISCDDCRQFWYDPETGTFTREGGKPLERPAGDKLLCEQQVGCFKGSPLKPRTLSARNRQAWRHYLECRAVGRWPDDPIVRRNAYVIGGAVQKVQKEIHERLVRSGRRATRQ